VTKHRNSLQSILDDVIAGQRPSTWITRERPKIDRIACPWVVLRFIDPGAKIIYAPRDRVLDRAASEDAIAFDIPGAPISHEGDLCSFDVLLQRFGLNRDPALVAIAPIVRGADTDKHHLAPEAAGLHAISLGLSKLHTDDDHALLAEGRVIYDALYAWAHGARGERHDWTPAP